MHPLKRHPALGHQLQRQLQSEAENQLCLSYLGTTPEIKTADLTALETTAGRTGPWGNHPLPLGSPLQPSPGDTTLLLPSFLSPSVVIKSSRHRSSDVLIPTHNLQGFASPSSQKTPGMISPEAERRRDFSTLPMPRSTKHSSGEVQADARPALCWAVLQQLHGPTQAEQLYV